MNIVDPILAHAQTRPQAAALVLIDGQAVTFGMLDTLVRRAAAFGLAQGLTAGSTVAMRIGGADEALGRIVALGLARIGVATCDPTVPPKHLTAALVAPGESPPNVARRIPLDSSWLTGAESLAPSHPGGDALFRIFSTSGTTGVPRFCPVTHTIMAARVAASGHPIARTSFSPILLCALGLDGNWATRIVLATLTGGGTVVFSNAASLLRTLVEQRVTTLVTSPAVLQSVLGNMLPTQTVLPDLRAVVTGGSRLPDPLWRLATNRLCPEILISFGASETSVVATGRYEQLAHVPQSVGLLEPGSAAQAVDENHQPLPPGTEGIIRVRTPGDIAGYLDNPEATATTFRDGWFYTGDIGAVTADGHLVITGRAVEIINHGGMKISPRIIEDMLLSVPEIGQAAAFGVPDNQGVVQVWAAIVTNSPVDGDALQRLCTARLGELAPKFIVQMPNLPRNANGKVMTHVLVDAAKQHYQSGAGAVNGPG
jgi:acyl-coenzyme A synthetase/AMP-(fatty) acid ligase